MQYDIYLKSPGSGECKYGYLSAENKKEAQDKVADLLVEAGFPRHRIAKQVVDYSTISIGLHTITIVQSKEFNLNKAKIMVALIEG